ncbi:Mbov_0396 family ICE element transmembrane protein [Mycoplasma enhydrae]|uniref:Mbov_0396 family ICE element transmembrane protein n=1 Tax=Mycoplasma enhydrae TaxID=2499220 RepID=UPI00197BD63A|nr:hypothetical protein [Mycoplasma enhydrae]MBN4089703.1 hypothetical protein [Mycoplasma enhydrae]
MPINLLQAALIPIRYAVFGVLWGVFISLPFLILKGLFKAAQFFGFELINIIIFGAKPGEFDFSFSKLPVAFLAFMLYALAFAIVFILISFAKYQLAKNKKQNMEHLKFKNVLRQSLSSFLWALLLPFLIFVINVILAIVFKYFGKVLELQAGTNLDVADNLYIALNNNAEWARTSVLQGQYYPMSLSEYANISLTSNTLIGLILIKNAIVAIMCVVFLGSILVAIVKYSLIQFTLFIVSPLVAAKAIDDNGIAIAKWKKEFTKSTLNIFISLISLNFFVIFILVLNPVKEKLGTSQALSLIADLIIYIGAAYATKSINKLVSNLLGIEISNFSFKKTGEVFKKTLGFGKQAAVAGAAVASGGATLGATMAKGGLSNALGGFIGKGINLSRVSSNKSLARDLGMSKGFIKSSFAHVGANKPLEQKKMLDTFRKAATNSKTGQLNKNALKDFDSLQKYNASQIKQNEKLLEQNIKNDKALDQKLGMFTQQELNELHARNAKIQLEYEQKISELNNFSKSLNQYDENYNPNTEEQNNNEKK